MLRQLLRRWSSTWVSSKVVMSVWSWRTLSITRAISFSMKAWVPHKGEPNRKMLSLGLDMLEGNSGKEESPQGQYTSHFWTLRKRPNSGPDLMMQSRKAAAVDWEATIVLSSKYQNCVRSGGGGELTASSSSARGTAGVALLYPRCREETVMAKPQLSSCVIAIMCPGQDFW